MSVEAFLDTNVLVYAAAGGEAEATKGNSLWSSSRRSTSESLLRFSKSSM